MAARMLAAFDVMGDISPVEAAPPRKNSGVNGGLNGNGLVNGHTNGHANGSAHTSPTKVNGSLNGGINGGINGHYKGSVATSPNGSVNGGLNGGLNGGINGGLNGGLNGHVNGSVPASPTKVIGDLNGGLGAPTCASAPTSPTKPNGVVVGTLNGGQNGGVNGGLNGGLNGAPKRMSNPENPPLVNNNHLINGVKKKSHMLTKQQTQSVFPRRPAVNLQFTDITCNMMTFDFGRRRFCRKQILHGVSGEFRSGELTAIMGPSGAGKSTLLNILAGYKTRGAGGQVAVNGQVRDDRRPEAFRRLCCYIQQDDALRPLLRVQEVMMLAANLKLGYTIPMASKRHKVREILTMLGLEAHVDTQAGRLSGGQKKRLSIALELLSNPPIIFLDEPTTGLDSSSTTQCVSLLKSLAKEGRTVVCTIHQPSALLFEMFDQLFAVAAGRCVYQGDTKGLVPFLAQQGLPCPPYHNPADFLMEVSSGDFGISVEALSDAAAKNSSRQPVVHPGAALTLEDEVVCPPPPAPLIIQFYLLFMRNIIIMRRDLSSLALRIFMHIFIGLVFGYLYRGVGSNAHDVLANVVYLYGSNLFLVYTGQMAVTLAFPLEVETLAREHFNRWYSLAPYLLSTVLVELPLQAVLCAFYLAPSFLLTGQPLELERIVIFYTFTTLASLTAQSCGFLFGATTPITISVFLGPVVAVLLSIFGFCIWYRDIPDMFRWMFHISYFRAAFHGSVYAMYALGRENLDCPKKYFYCHYRTPLKILDEMDITVVNFWENSATIVIFCVLVYVATVCVIWFRLNRR